MTSTSSEPARFVHSKEDARQVFTGFRTFYWALEVVWVVAAVVNPAAIVLAVGWPVVLLLWEASIRRADRTEWVLEVSGDAITVGDRSVQRADASFVRFRRRTMRYAAWTELQVVGPSGRPVFAEGIRDDHRDGIAAALRERGWRVEG